MAKVFKDKQGFERVETTPKKIRKAAKDYHTLVNFIREKKPFELHIHPNQVEFLRKEHLTYQGTLEDTTQGLQDAPKLIIEGCLIVPDWSK